MVECFLAKEDVAGSTPVSRSNFHPICDTLLLPSSRVYRDISQPGDGMLGFGAKA